MLHGCHRQKLRQKEKLRSRMWSFDGISGYLGKNSVLLIVSRSTSGDRAVQTSTRQSSQVHSSPMLRLTNHLMIHFDAVCTRPTKGTFECFRAKPNSRCTLQAHRVTACEHHRQAIDFVVELKIEVLNEEGEQPNSAFFV